MSPALAVAVLAALAAWVDPLPAQDAGLVPVGINGSSVGEIFYWFIPPANGDAKAPVLIWLQGGPGASGMLGAFKELGPYQLLKNGPIVPREANWCSEFACLFVDQPVGTGYSSATVYADSEEAVAEALFDFLKTFFTSHAEWKGNPFFITGESYGGHFVPSLAYLITNKAMSGDLDAVDLNLCGIAIGDGLTDPANQITAKPAQAYDFGLVDFATYSELDALAKNASALANDGQFRQALALRVTMESTVQNKSGVNLYDVRTFGLYDDSDLNAFLNSAATRRAFQLPDGRVWNTDAGVHDALAGDILKSNAWKFPLLLSQMRVLLYQGQFDWKDGTASNQAWIRKLKWPGSKTYASAPRNIWRGGQGEIYGWATEARDFNLTEVVVAGAGHLVPMNQPVPALDMITRFVRNRPFA